MYKESINDRYVVSRHETKTSTGPWTLSQQWNITLCDNLRTSGENTPGFHRRLKAGELLPFTNFLQLENKTSAPSVNYHVRNNTDGSESRWIGGGLVSGDQVPWTGGSGIGSGKTDDNAIMQAAGARQVSASWDVLTFAAEVGQTVAMFKNLLTKVINLLNTKPPGTPWNVWLELRYGWRTLAYDIEDIEKAFSRSSTAKFNRTSAGQSVSWQETTSATYVQGWFTKIEKSLIVYKLNARGKVITKGQPPRFQINLLKTAWEVTRLSFVVDWFINVGRFIDALQFYLTMESQSGLGKYIEVEGLYWNEFVQNSSWTILSRDSKHLRTALITMRGPASVPLIPLLSVNIDRFKVLDLIALLIQALRR